MANVRGDNPFYKNYVFNKIDLYRAKIKWWHYPTLLFRPMYTQIAEGYAFHYKTTANGRIFLFEVEEL